MLADVKQQSAVQVLHNAGLDFVIIDNEHGMFTNEQLSALCRYAVAIGITPIVRVPDLQYHLIAQSLDGGAQGLVLPRIYTAEEVRRVVSYARYPPLGLRGSAQWRAYAGWRGGGVRDCMDVMNREVLLLFQIETAESVRDMEEILSVPGVDGTLVGPNDLSINLGTPDDWESDVMQAAMRKVVDVCDRLGLISGIHISDAQQSVRYGNMGYRLLSANSETGFMQGAATEFVKTVKGSLGRDKAISWDGKEKAGKAGY
jgi:2-keto-3-deoxy-L-rhamnonate aldolase RhmA